MADRKFNLTETRQWLRTARTLTEALPYLRRYDGRTFVIKYGGHAMGDRRLSDNFANDIVLLKHAGVNPIIVHGGGPQIGRMLERLNIRSTFVDGLRVTDAATVEVVEMVLSGSINKQVVQSIARAGGRAVGLSGKDGGLIRARKLTRSRSDPASAPASAPASDSNRVPDLGFVGEPEAVDAGILRDLLGHGLIPVIAPIAAGPGGETYNINADTVAGAVAGASAAVRMFLLTDVRGVLDRNGALVPELTVAGARALMADGTIAGGMIPKVETCIRAIEDGVEAAVILDGRVPHSMLLEIFTASGTGTLIRADRANGRPGSSLP